MGPLEITFLVGCVFSEKTWGVNAESVWEATYGEPCAAHAKPYCRSCDCTAMAQAQFNLECKIHQSELELSCIAGLRLFDSLTPARELKTKTGIKRVLHAHTVPYLGYLVRLAAALTDLDERSRILGAVIAVANAMQVARTNRFRTPSRAEEDASSPARNTNYGSNGSRALRKRKKERGGKKNKAADSLSDVSAADQPAGQQPGRKW